MPNSHGPKLNRDWVGLRVVLRRPAENQLCTIPTGTAGVIAGYTNGARAIRFRGDKCECCGVAVHISGMRRQDFIILTPPEEWPNTQGKGRHHKRRSY